MLVRYTLIVNIGDFLICRVGNNPKVGFNLSLQNIEEAQLVRNKINFNVKLKMNSVYFYF